MLSRQLSYGLRSELALVQPFADQTAEDDDAAAAVVSSTVGVAAAEASVL